MARVLAGDPGDLAPALAAHQAELEGEAQRLSETLAQVAALRRALAYVDANDTLDFGALLPSIFDAVEG